MAKIIKEFQKDPDAVLDYTLDWTPFLSGDTILTSTWLVPTGITKDSDSKTSSTATVILSGGTARNTYIVTNRIVTVGGIKDDRSLRIFVEEQ